MIEVRVHSELDAMKARAIELLTERHDDEEDVTVLTQGSVLDSFTAITAAAQAPTKTSRVW